MLTFSFLGKAKDSSLNEIMEECSTIVQVNCRNLNESDVTFKELTLLKNCQMKFLEILSIILNDDKEMLNITQRFQQLSKQFEDYRETYNVMSYIDEFLQKLPENIGKRLFV